MIIAANHRKIKVFLPQAKNHYNNADAIGFSRCYPNNQSNARWLYHKSFHDVHVNSIVYSDSHSTRWYHKITSFPLHNFVRRWESSNKWL